MKVQCSKWCGQTFPLLIQFFVRRSARMKYMDDAKMTWNFLSTSPILSSLTHFPLSFPLSTIPQILN